MYSYCNNNPLAYKDTSGTLPMLAIAVVTIVGGILIKGSNSLAQKHPDGVRVDKEQHPDGSVTETLYAKGNKTEINKNGISLLDFNAGISTSYIETPNGRDHYLSILHANATASVDWSGIPEAGVSAVASVLTLNKTFTIKLPTISIEISAGAHVGAIGVSAEFDFEEFKFAYSPPSYGVIPNFGIDIDWN